MLSIFIENLPFLGYVMLGARGTHMKENVLSSKGSYRAGMEGNMPTVTELAGWGADRAALMVQCRGRSGGCHQITQLPSSRFLNLSSQRCTHLYKIPQILPQ